MEGTYIPAATQSAHEITEFEAEQAAVTWRDIVRDTRGRLGTRALPERVQEIGRLIFVLGFVTGVRNGTGAPALTGTPIKPEVIAKALRKLRRSVRVEVAGDDPTIGQQVEYHGSVREAHGWYFVVGIYEVVDAAGVVSKRYDLRKLITGGSELFEARRASITPMAYWDEVHRRGE